MRRLFVLAAVLGGLLLVAATGVVSTASGTRAAAPPPKKERAPEVPTPQAGPPAFPRRRRRSSGRSCPPAGTTRTRARGRSRAATSRPRSRTRPRAARWSRSTRAATALFSVDKSITIAGAPGAHVAVTAFAGTGDHRERRRFGHGRAAQPLPDRARRAKRNLLRDRHACTSSRASSAASPPPGSYRTPGTTRWW